MKDIGLVQGDKEQAVPLVIGKDTVYVHTDIEELPTGSWQYHEVQYGKDEYIQLMSERNDETQALFDAMLAGYKEAMG